MLAPAGQWGLRAEKDGKDEEAGVTVREVLPGGAAAAAGLKAGDRLLTIDGRWTDSVADLYEAAGRIKPGTTVKVTVKRAGKEVEPKVTPATAGERGAPYPGSAFVFCTARAYIKPVLLWYQDWRNTPVGASPLFTCGPFSSPRNSC